MLIVTAKMKIKPETENIFLEKTKPLIEGSRAEKGCIEYALYKSTEEENTFIMVEQWQNQEIFDKHAASAHFKQFGVEAGPLFAAELDVKVYPIVE